VGALPFADDSFDVVIASQMTHHLTNEEAAQHFREAWRVTRDALFLADVHRNAGALCVVWMVLRLMRVTPQFLSDGLLSVRRSWRVGEWREIAEQAGIRTPGYGCITLARVVAGAETAAEHRQSVRCKPSAGLRNRRRAVIKFCAVGL